MTNTTTPHYVYAIYNTAGKLIKCDFTTVSTVPYNGHDSDDVRIHAIVTSRDAAIKLLEVLKTNKSLDGHVDHVQPQTSGVTS